MIHPSNSREASARYGLNFNLLRRVQQFAKNARWWWWWGGAEVPSPKFPLRTTYAPRALLEGERGEQGSSRAITERSQGVRQRLGWLLAVGNAVGAGVGVWECLWGRAKAGVFGGEPPLPPSFKRFPVRAPTYCTMDTTFSKWQRPVAQYGLLVRIQKPYPFRSMGAKELIIKPARGYGVRQKGYRLSSKGLCSMLTIRHTI